MNPSEAIPPGGVGPLSTRSGGSLGAAFSPCFSSPYFLAPVVLARARMNNREARRSGRAQRWLPIALVLALTALAPARVLAAASVPLYFHYHSGTLEAPSVLNNDHPLLSGAFVGVWWAGAEVAPGQFDWSTVERHVTESTASGRRVVLKVIPYNQEPLASSPTGDNTQTPVWIYGAGVPRITFSQGGPSGGTVSVPKVWHPRFYTHYGAFVGALARRFDGDPRIAAIQIGLGHNGNSNAQPSSDGARAFERAGWTLPGWERHMQRTIRLFKRHFRAQPLILPAVPAFLRSYDVIDHLDVGCRVARYAAERRVSILFSGMDPDEARFTANGVPAVLASLGALNPRPRISVGFTDDFPLWVGLDRSASCPGPTCGRDVEGFGQSLRLATEAWRRYASHFPHFFVFREPEATATNANRPEFNPPLYDAAVASLFR
jgi:hypothetical protein